MRDNDDRRQVMPGFDLQPVDLNKSLALLHSQAAQRPAVAAMDDDSFIGIEESDNRVAGQRAAAVGEPDNSLRYFTVPIVAVGMVPIFNRLRLLLHLAGPVRAVSNAQAPPLLAGPLAQVPHTGHRLSCTSYSY